MGMDTQNLLTKSLYLVVSVILLVFSGLYVWWRATPTLPASPDKTPQFDAETCLIYQDVGGQAARTKLARKGRCLLSLDGGGIRTLSQITILYEISNRIKHDLRLDEMPRLCDYFDIIGGVGTGGLLAILIGRLGLTVQQAEKEYLTLMDHISSVLLDAPGLNRMLQRLIKKYTGDSETLMYDTNSPTNHCKMFVGATAAVNISQLVKFRSFESRQGQEHNLPIWKVARTALGYPGLLPPAQLGAEHTQITYLSGELGWNNPSKEVIKEFEAEWKPEGILCFASIGSGHQGAIQVNTPNFPNSLSSTAEKMAMDCQRIAEDIAHRFQGQNNYFRLSVEQGFQQADGQKELKLEDVVVHTKAYLDSTWANTSVDRLVTSLLRADTVFPWQTTGEMFKTTVERYLRNIRASMDRIEINAIKEEARVAILMLDLIQQVNSDEEEWLELVKPVGDYTLIVVQDLIPKIWEPHLEHPLWPSISEYFIELRKVHTNAKALLELHSDHMFGTNTDQNLLSKWAADLGSCLKAIQAVLSGEAYGKMALLWKRQQEKEREELLSWLSSLQPDRKQTDAKAKRFEGTGGWFLNAEDFIAWCNLKGVRNSRVLLGLGSPGSGKTTLFSMVVNYLLQAIIEPNVAVIFIYCDYQESISQTITGLIGSLAKQLLSRVRSVSAAVWDAYKKMAEQQKSIDLESAQEIFKLVLQGFDCVYICIDAVDECQSDARRQLLEFLMTVTGTTLHLFMTGRPNVEAELTTSFTDMSMSKIVIAAHRDDLLICLSQKFAEDRYKEAMDEELKAEITAKVIEWSQGIFLLPMLQIATVLEHDTKRSRKKALSHIPTELSDTYKVTVQRIRQQPLARLERAILILTWIYHAERPLRVIELLCALAVEAGDTTFREDGMPSAAALVDCCLGLVVIEQETSTVRFTHFTVQEYFDKHRDDLLPSGHTLIAKTCLAYLGFDHTSNLRTIEHSSPFIEYVGSNMGHHLRKGGDATTDERILGLLNKQDKFTILKMFMGRLVSPTHPREYVHESSPLHWVAIFGVYTIAELVLQSIDNINKEENYMHRTPLSCAAANGHCAVVRLLIKAPRVDLNPKDKFHDTPLSLAAYFGRDTVVKLLTNTAGVDLNPKDADGRTPLAQAALRGHSSIAQLLISTSGIDFNPRDISYNTPLSLAGYFGHSTVVELLAKTAGVNLNPKDADGRTPLAQAVLRGHSSIAQLLISTPGVNLNMGDLSKNTPLSLAASFGLSIVVELLVSTPGINLNAKNADGRTPLAQAAVKGHDSVVQLLVNTPGIDLNPSDIAQDTPLSLAAYFGRDTVVELLVNTAGVDLNPKDADGRTPLAHAAMNGHNSVVQLLVSTPGIDLNTKNAHGWTPLAQAAMNGHNSVVQLLVITPGIDLNASDATKHTPLSLAAYFGHDTVVELLANTAGIDPNPKNTKGQTPLALAVEKGHSSVVELLVNTPGIDPNTKDADSQTALTKAASRGHSSVVQLLISTPGIDLNTKDPNGRTPLAQAAVNGHDSVVKLLVSTPGIDFNASDAAKHTPLSLAAYFGRDTVVELLANTAGVDLNPKDADGRTPLAQAALRGHISSSRLLISTPGVDLNPKNTKGQTPLALAAEKGHSSVVELLVNTPGIDPNTKDVDSRTALTHAALRGHSSVVQLLISTPNTDLNTKDMDGRTPLALAVVKGHNSVVQLLVSTPGVDLNASDANKHTPLSLAAYFGRDTVAELLANTSGVDLNPKDVNGRTPLALAAEKGYNSVSQLLISTPDIDLNPSDIAKNTPLSLAAYFGRASVVKLLVSTAGVDLNQKNVDGRTSLAQAAVNGHDSVVKLLISTPGIDLNMKDVNGRTPLTLAAGKGYNSVVQLLVSTPGIDLNASDATKDTPLSLAAYFGHDTVIKLLANTAGIDLNQKNVDGRTPLAQAAVNGHNSVVQHLISTPGVDLDSRDKDGKTALDLATETGHDSVIQLLESALSGQSTYIGNIETLRVHEGKRPNWVRRVRRIWES